MEIKSNTGWAAKMAESMMLRRDTLSDVWTYDYGVVLRGFVSLYEKTGNEKYYDYIKRSIDGFVDADGNIPLYSMTEYNLDNILIGRLLFPLYHRSGDPRYKQAAAMLRKQLDSHPRTSEGAFWHKKIYPYQIWLDGLYMASPFYAEYIRDFGDGDYTDVLRQFKLCERHLRDAKIGLLYHAWDEKHEQFWCDPATGLSKNFWGRSVGWFVMALADVIDILPPAHPEREWMIGLLSDVLDSLERVRDQASGVFWQVLDKPNQKGNYLESSASCMVCYAIAKGLRGGYLPSKWAAVAKQLYQGILDEFITVRADGLVNLGRCCQVAGLGGKDRRDGTYAYYISEPIVTNDLKGVGAFIQAAAEMENL